MRAIFHLNLNLIAATVAGIAVLCQTANAADFQLTLEGTYRNSSSDSYGFDGTDFFELPSPLALDTLKGGTFAATYRFTDALYSGGDYFHSFPKANNGIVFTLYDSHGVSLNEANGPSYFTPSVFILTNLPPPSSSVQVTFSDISKTISNLNVPATTYNGIPLQIVRGSINFSSSALSGTPLLLSELPYSSFTNGVFVTNVEWVDGDPDGIDPFQYESAQVIYSIQSTHITAIVPEPNSMALLLGLSVVGTSVLMRPRKR